MRPESLDILRMLSKERGSVGVMARAVLAIELSGGNVCQVEPVAPVSESRGLSNAERQARYRAQKRNEEPVTRNVTPVTIPVTSNGEVTDRNGVTPSPLGLSSPSSSLSFSENLEKERGDSFLGTRDGVTEPVTALRNVTGDGAFGMLVTSWADGIRSVTGSSFPPPRGRAGGQLSETLKDVCAGASDACAAAREAGAEYAAKNAGRTLSPFHFGDWLGSGKPDANAPRVFAKPDVGLNSDGLDPNSAAASERRKKRQQAERDAEIKMRLEQLAREKAAAQ